MKKLNVRQRLINLQEREGGLGKGYKGDIFLLLTATQEMRLKVLKG